jgi:hypothetical protein
MTGLKSLSAVTLLAAVTATAATAQQALQAPRVPEAAVDTGRIAGVVTTPPQVRDSLAPYTGKSADDSFAYYGDRPVTRLTPCGLQSGATYMGPDGRWYPC